MSKREDGVWTMQTTPLEANGHLYWFNLDGVACSPWLPVLVSQRRPASQSKALDSIPGRTPEGCSTPERRAAACTRLKCSFRQPSESTCGKPLHLRYCERRPFWRCLRETPSGR